MIKKVKSHKFKKFQISPVKLSILILYLILMILFIFYHLFYAKKIIPGVYVGDINTGGLTVSELVQRLSDEVETADVVKVKVGNGDEFDINKSDIDFRILPVETAKNAFKIGRSQNLVTQASNKFFGLFKKNTINLSYDYNRDKLTNIIPTSKSSSLIPIAEPKFEYDSKNGLTIVQGQSGELIDESFMIQEILDSFVNNKNEVILVETRMAEPNFTVLDLDFVKDEMDEFVSTKYEIKTEDKTWVLTPNEILNIFKPKKTDSRVSLVIDDQELKNYLMKIVLQVDRNPRGQILNVENNRAVEFVSSQNGLKVKVEESFEVLENSLLAKVSPIELVVEKIESLQSENKFGIDDVIGVGYSKFVGSIAGRVFNIELASSRVNGVMVAPGDIFSFNESIGEISRKTGYTSAWIISKGRTVLGDGGGVCQVSTTVFRSALDAGLPIVERNAHSYRVGYYEQDSPVGIDATIYSPSVDLRFKNDTPGYILISSEFNKENSTLKFIIYGTNDGRKVTITEPKVLSRTPPPASIYEEDSSLQKGKTIQVEQAVWGASVVFERSVTRDGEVISHDTFKSNYRAWGAVYKVGTKE